MKHETYCWKNLHELKEKLIELKIDPPISTNIRILSVPIEINGKTLNNRIAVLPIEGCDANGGSPSELTIRRYTRFALSGASLIWLEAVAVTEDGRANPKQLMITSENYDQFKSLLSLIKERCLKKYGFEPFVAIQLTHSGRYSKPYGKPIPLTAFDNDILDPKHMLSKRIVSDAYLDRLPDYFANAAVLAHKAGFDAIDVKACHGYLINELLSAHTREGRYGGPFENRIRLLVNILDSIRSKNADDIELTSRLSIYDGIPWPFGWGMNSESTLEVDLSEPSRLIKILQRDYNIKFIAPSFGNPYYNPHVNRPFNTSYYIPPEHALESLARAVTSIAGIKRSNPDMIIVSAAHSYLREFSVNSAAGMLDARSADIAGFGRMSIAYPDFACDIVSKQALTPSKCCIACGKCSELLRAGVEAGCPVHDLNPYREKYKSLASV